MLAAVCRIARTALVLPCKLPAARPVATGSAIGAGCHEAVRRWAYRALPVHPEQRYRPPLRATPSGSAQAAPGDLQVAKNLLSGIVVLFPLVAIPWLEAQRGRIGRLEAEVAERDRQLRWLRTELETAWKTNSAAVSGVIF